MSEAAFNPADLLSTLAANPQMLKDAMQMASALASSGVLSGLFQKEEQPKSESSNDHRGEGEPNRTAPSGDLAGLLAGLQGGQSGSASGEHRDAGNPISGQNISKDASARDAHSGKNPAEEHKRGNPPCHNDRIQLLRSLRPFLPEEKRDKIDFLVQLLGLLNAAEQMGLGKLF